MKKIIKRDGRKVNFDISKIYKAILDAFDACEKNNVQLVEKITDEVVAFLDKKFIDEIPYVEDVQNAIEKSLIKHNQADVAKAFILYRHERTRSRNFRNGYYDKIMNYLTLNYSKIDLVNYISNDFLTNYFLDSAVNKNLLKSINASEIYVRNLFSYGLCFEDETIDLIEYLSEINKQESLEDLYLYLFRIIGTIHNEISGLLTVDHFELIFDKISKMNSTKKGAILSINFVLSSLNQISATGSKICLKMNKNSENYIKNAMNILNIISDKDYKNLIFNFDNDDALAPSFYKNIYLNKVFVISNNVLARKTLFTYFINAIHFPNKKVELTKFITDQLNIIATSSLERIKAIKTCKNFVNTICLYNKEENFEKVVKKFNINISLNGLFEFLNKNPEVSKNDVVNVIKKSCLEISNKYGISYNFTNSIDIESSLSLQARDRKLGFVESNFYSNGLFYPFTVEANINEKISYENCEINFSSPSIFFIRRKDFTLEKFNEIINKLKTNNINCYSFFIDDSDINNDIEHRFPVSKLCVNKLDNDKVMSLTFMAKPLNIE